MFWYTRQGAANSKIYEVYTEGTDVFFGKPAHNKKAKPWTWMIQIEDVNELIPAQGLVMKSNGCLSASSIEVIKSVCPKATMRKF